MKKAIITLLILATININAQQVVIYPFWFWDNRASTQLQQLFLDASSFFDDALRGKPDIPTGVPPADPEKGNDWDDDYFISHMMEVDGELDALGYLRIKCWNLHEASQDDIRQLMPSLIAVYGHRQHKIVKVKGVFHDYLCLYLDKKSENEREWNMQVLVNEVLYDLKVFFREWYDDNKESVNYFMLGLRTHQFTENVNRYIISPSWMLPKAMAETAKWQTVPTVLSDGRYSIVTNNPDIPLSIMIPSIRSAITNHNITADIDNELVEIYVSNNGDDLMYGFRTEADGKFKLAFRHNNKWDNWTLNVTDSFALLFDPVSRVFLDLLNGTYTNGLQERVWEFLRNWNDLSHVLVTDSTGKITIDYNAITDCQTWRLAGAFKWRGFTEPINIHPANGLDAVFAAILPVPKPCDCTNSCPVDPPRELRSWEEIVDGHTVIVQEQYDGNGNIIEVRTIIPGDPIPPEPPVVVIPPPVIPPPPVITDHVPSMPVEWLAPHPVYEGWMILNIPKQNYGRPVTFPSVSPFTPKPPVVYTPGNPVKHKRKKIQ
jgi:hypothetical protein